jgi:hypothetical protein
MSAAKNLWRLDNSITQKNSSGNAAPIALPYIVRDTGGVNAESSVASSVASNIKDMKQLYVYNQDVAFEDIDIVRDFPWTKSPQTSRGDVPYIYLIEKRLVTSSIVSNIANSILVAKDIGQTNLPDVVLNYFDKGATYATNFLQGAFQVNNPNANGPVSTFGKATAKAVRQAKKLVFENDLKSPTLTPYNNLYVLENTGFKYKLPYFDSSINSSNTFGESSDNILEAIAEKGRTAANVLTSVTSFLKPGVYIEKTKQFSMNEGGRTIGVKFPLLNTINYDDIRKNWQLIFALVYQNKPGRVTRSVIDVPVLYEVSLPGNVYLPYAYISSLSINFLGNRRMMSIELPPGFETKTVETIVPDAYEISLEVTGLNPDSRNFMIAGVNKNPVTVNQSPTPQNA